MSHGDYSLYLQQLRSAENMRSAIQIEFRKAQLKGNFTFMEMERHASWLINL